MLRALLLCLQVLTVQPDGNEPDEPVRVILVIADGAGLAYWDAARFAADSLATLDLPVIGLVDAGNTSGLEPESGSGATSFAIGLRTHAGAIGVGPDSEPRATVLEVARAAGRATGLVTTTYLVDATPAAFAAHVASRRQVDEIARQMAGAGVDVLLGDGRGFFDGSAREDGEDLLAGMRADYALVDDPAALLPTARADSVQRLAGFFAIDAVTDPTARTPSLATMTEAALAVLDRDPEGFFLLVESEHTDHRGHDNASLQTIAAEVLEVDRAVRTALAYRERRPETLVLVAADHETGGLALVPHQGHLFAKWATQGHTPALVPLFAVGPGAERFGGVRTNADVGAALLDIVRDRTETADSDGEPPGQR